MFTKTLSFDTYLHSGNHNSSFPQNVDYRHSSGEKDTPFHESNIDSMLSQKSSSIAPVLFTSISTVSTLTLIYWISRNLESKSRGNRNRGAGAGRSTPLPGYGILGDKVNEFIELFLDALAVYVHNDNKWECQRRMLCEANQRANDYGLFQGVIMYFLSLGVSLLLQNQRVSESLEAMKFGRKGNDCTHLYPKCPFSL